MNRGFIQNLSSFNQTVLESMGLSSEKEIIKRMVEKTVLILKADFGYAFFKDTETGIFKLLYKDKNTPFNPKQPRKRGATQKAFSSKQPLYVKSAPNTSWIRKDAKKYMKGVVVIPISYKNINFGTLDICYKSSHRFIRSEKILCQYIGNSVAQIIAASRLYSTLKKHQKTLQDKIEERTKELRENNAILEQDQAKDKALLTSIGLGIIATDNNGLITLVNPRAEEITGLSRKYFLGKQIHRVLELYEDQSGYVPWKNTPVYKALTAKKTFESKDTHLINAKKEKVPIYITASPIKLKGRLLGVIAIFNDISKEKEIDRAKSELISLASHQLRTPLSAINWYAEVLRKEELGRLNTGQKKYLEEINKANQKMIELVYDFLNVSRIELGTFQVKLAVINVPELSKGVIKELLPLTMQKKIIIRESYSRGMSNLVGDKKILRIVLQNLLSNAVKYTPDGGKVNLSINFENSKTLGASLKIEVADNGYGIPKHHQAKVFSKLFRADNVAKLDTQGSGLGLYITKSLVDFSNGKIWFKSKLNSGTSFYVKLPLNSWKIMAKPD